MRYYVKVLNGQIVEGPKAISSSPFESPNTQWSEEQMKLNSFFEVNIDCDGDSEFVDLQNPTITDENVSYNIIKYPDETAFENLRERTLKSFYSQMLNEICKKYDLQYQIIGCLNLLSGSELAGLSEDVQAIYNEFLNVKNQIQAATSKEEILIIKASWPQ